MTTKRRENLEECQGLIGYRFRSLELLDAALTHRSFAMEQTDARGRDNERLEFLGDAVLGLCLADILWRRFPDDPEGTLSRRRSAWASERCLADLARGLSLGRFLLLGRGEEMSGGREKVSLLADTLEAVIAAVYLDGGIAAAREVIQRLFSPLLQEQAGPDDPYRDHKSLLQELCQRLYHELPRYLLLREEGPDHDKTFVVAVEVPGGRRADGTGKSRREAEQAAAREMLEVIHGEG